MLKKYAIATLLSAVIMMPAAIAHASSEIQLTDEIVQKIRSTLEGQGYWVGKIKIEDGLYEAYAKKESNKFEIYLNAQMQIVRSVKN
jgi:hypothetical protein